jgi:DNA-binding NarL/FixJ family response regulator
MPKNKVKTTHAERRAIRRAAAEAVGRGECPKKVAQRFGRGLAWVLTSARECGVRVPSDRVPQRFVVLAAVLRGETDIEIARKLNVTRQNVSALRRAAAKAGIPINQKRSRAKTA